MGAALSPVVVVGVLAALCSVGSFLPQAVKIWRERDASAVSLQMYLVTAAGFALWIAYGLLLKSWPLIVSNAASLLISSSILGLKIRFSGGGARA